MKRLSVRKTLTLTTSLKPMPPAFSTWPMFLKTWVTCFSMPSRILPRESTPTWPETKRTRAPCGISAPRLYLPASETDLGLWYLMAMAAPPYKEAHGFRSRGMTSSIKTVHIVGGGLAGSEAAWQLTAAGVPVVLHEMRPVRGTEAHQTDGLAELVCSNSFRSDDAHNNAVGLLHEEMRRAGSLIMRAADAHKLPAGGALAVDRHGFSAAVQQTLLAHPLVELRREEVAGLPPTDWTSVIITTGPLTSPALAEAIRTKT